MIRRDSGRRHVPRRHQAGHRPSTDSVTTTRVAHDSRRISPRRRADRDQRRAADASTSTVTNRGDRPDPGRLALSFLRSEPRARVRSRGARTACGSNIAGGHRRALRAGRRTRGGAGRARRAARRVAGSTAWSNGALDDPTVRGSARWSAVADVFTRTASRHEAVDRRTYADHYGPTTGDRIRLADTDLIDPDRARLRRLRRRGEVRRRQGDSRRHGAVADRRRATAARPISSSRSA